MVYGWSSKQSGISRNTRHPHGGSRSACANNKALTCAIPKHSGCERLEIPARQVGEHITAFLDWERRYKGTDTLLTPCADLGLLKASLLQRLLETGVMPDGSLEVLPLHANGSGQVIICDHSVRLLVEEGVKLINSCLELPLQLAGERFPIVHMTA